MLQEGHSSTFLLQHFTNNFFHLDGSDSGIADLLPWAISNWTSNHTHTFTLMKLGFSMSLRANHFTRFLKMCKRAVVPFRNQQITWGWLGSNFLASPSDILKFFPFLDQKINKTKLFHIAFFSGYASGRSSARGRQFCFEQLVLWWY